MPRISAVVRRALAKERQSQILAAAAKVFDAQGYDQATVAEIAKEAGLAQGSIYNYFESKGDLLAKLPRRPNKMSIQPLIVPDEGKPCEEAVTAMAEIMLATLRANVRVLRILLSAFPQMRVQVRDAYWEQATLRVRLTIQSFIENQIAHRVFRDDLEPAVLASLIIGMLFTTVLVHDVLQIDAPESADDEEIISTAVKVLMHGVMSDSHSPDHC